MEMERISYSLREMLVRQGIEAVRAGHTGRHGIGLEKDGAAKPRQFNREVVKTEMEETTLQTAAIATTKGARIIRQAPFLLIMDGGRA